jgi:hypothetical protein
MAGSVYVLGAGFSHGFNKELFPLIRDFLCLAKANHFYYPDDQHQQLAHVITKYFHDPLYPDIEKVLSFFSVPPLHHRTIPYEHRSVAYDELVELIVHSLSEASEAPPLSAEIKDAYNKFAKHLVTTESTVITFNYDLLLENLLIEIDNWQPYYGYGANIPPAYKAMPTPPHTFLHQELREDTDMRWRKVTLLKMHGSINWGIPTITSDKSEDIFQLPSKGGVSMADFALETEFGAPFAMYFKPVIVPPVLDKSSWLQNRSFRVIWNMAMQSIAQAEDITFLGYSLPTTDFMAEFMFRQGVNLITAERKITVVAPKASTELKKRYEDVFGSVGVTSLSFKDYDVVSYVKEVIANQSDKVITSS